MSERALSSSPRNCSGEQKAGCAQERAGGGERGLRADGGRDGEAEVADLHRAVFAHVAIRGLNVAVEDADALGRLQPSTICSTQSTASPIGNGPRARTRSCKVPPGTSSIAMTGVPPISSVPKI